MINVVLIGNGNVGFHLTQALLSTKNAKLVQVYNRSLPKISYLKEIVSITNQIEKLKRADVYIISVSDNAIETISNQLNVEGLVVHTSGATPITSLKQKSRGVFYPLQTFSRSKSVCFSEIPICIEASSKKNEDLLEILAKSLSKKVFKINSEQRKSLHVSAVYVCNFVNHLYYMGQQLCEKHQVPFEVLQPLINETSQKIKTLSPFEAQTGPAMRNDTNTVQKHLQMLNENQKEIYTLLTKSIYETYKNGKKL